jgi:hypothetical protein
MAIGAMTTSIVGVALLSCYGIGFFACVAGAILGHVARKQVAERNEAGGGMALAGIIIGWIGTGLGLLGVALFAVFFFTVVASSS